MRERLFDLESEVDNLSHQRDVLLNRVKEI